MILFNSSAFILPDKLPLTVGIRTKSDASSPVTVVLTNPDGRLRFPGSGDTTKTLALPLSGAWVPFQISGEKPSQALGDAIIQAHCKTPDGEIKAKIAVTVFWFDEASIKVTPDTGYSKMGDLYHTYPGPAVRFSAKASIKPTGVSCSAPQIARLKIGIVQDLISSHTEVTWSNPTAPAGTQPAAAQIRRTTILRGPLADTDQKAAPLYDQPGLLNRTLDPHSLMPPIGCSGGGEATSRDTPYTFSPTPDINAKNYAGTIIGKIEYKLKNVIINDEFRTYVVVFDTTTKRVCALRECLWQVHANSDLRQQRATAQKDSVPTTDPARAENGFATDKAKEQENNSPVPVGTDMVTF